MAKDKNDKPLTKKEKEEIQKETRELMAYSLVTDEVTTKIGLLCRFYNISREEAKRFLVFRAYCYFGEE